MSKVLAFGASSSKKSINKKFAIYVANCIPSAEINVIDLNDYEMPIYSIDKEEENGIPELAYRFKEH
ncbi:MAG: NADPH-dependent FMN reductase, partial [Flavobacteriales bacterium]|nr:NADPH-dependent FMN reductase [Flavobacteriales bacterium]